MAGGRRKNIIVGKEKDGGRLEYFSSGKHKSMKTQDFLKLTIFRDELSAKLLHILFEEAGHFKLIIHKTFDNHHPSLEDISEVRATLSNLISNGLVKYIQQDGVIGHGGYYTLTEEGAEWYVNTTEEKLMKIFKEVIKKFIKTEKDDDYMLPTLFLFIILAEGRKIPTLLASVYSDDEEPIPIRDILDAYFKFEIKVNKSSEERIKSEGYEKSTLHRLHDLVNKNVIERVLVKKNDNNITCFRLTERGRKITSPIAERLGEFIDKLIDFGLATPEPDKVVIPDRLWLTHFGRKVREKYLERLSTELGSYMLDDNTNPPMPIEELPTETVGQKFQLKLTTGKAYTISKRFIDKIKNIDVVTIFIMIILSFIFFAIVGGLIGSIGLVWFCIAGALISTVIFVIFVGITELRIKIK